METWSFYSAGIRIARFWPAAGTLEWACLDDGAGQKRAMRMPAE